MNVIQLVAFATRIRDELCKGQDSVATHDRRRGEQNESGRD